MIVTNMTPDEVARAQAVERVRHLAQSVEAQRRSLQDSQDELRIAQETLRGLAPELFNL